MCIRQLDYMLNFQKYSLCLWRDVGHFHQPGLISPFCQQERVSFPLGNYLSQAGFSFGEIVGKGGLSSPGQGVVEARPNITLFSP